MQEILLEIIYSERRLPKILRKSITSLLSNPVPFYGNCYEKPKGLKLITSPFPVSPSPLPIMLISFLSLVTHHLTIFDTLIQRAF